MSKKVLIISHNVLSTSENMGKTLLSYFQDWGKGNLAQLYFHSQVPVTNKCIRYYRFTDMDALKSIVLRGRYGRSYNEGDINKELITSRVDTGIQALLYEKGRKRTSLIYWLRNTVWALSSWHSKKLNRWIDEFNPNAVFFASGDYSFAYRIAIRIASERHIPLYMACFDDYYLYNSNNNSFLGRAVYSNYMKWVRKTAAYSECIFCVCEKMAKDYSDSFKKSCYTVYASTEVSNNLPMISKRKDIVYLGNIGLNRHLSLLEIGHALKKLNLPDVPNHIDVYSAEKRREILRELNEENGIVFHGAVSSDEVKKIIRNSMLVIHTESFDSKTIPQVRYSVSTKIADCLSSGTCILAYGPPNVASMEYLTENKAAYIINSKEDLENGLKEIISNKFLRKKIVKNAVQLSYRNHDRKTASVIIKDIIENDRTSK